MEIQIRKLLLLLMFFACCGIHAQRLSDAGIIAQKAKAELDAATNEGGDIWEYAQKVGLKGDFEFEFLIAGKGKVITVRKIFAEGPSIAQQNAFKDYLFNRRFQFKMIKGSQFNFSQEFKF